MKMPYTLESLEKMDSILQDHENRKMIFAIDDSDRIIAAVYILYDNKCAYYLIGGTQKIIHNVYKSDLLTDLVYKFAKRNKKLIRNMFRL